ncbi:uncharacterized protein LOC110043456 [Orbicella faveolata]|uniref:uncharacterized protein LOC110043456 n=1 Tax=Orbicella faveolata TaxID=48498 RepID=UPI0009E273BB|nr:uncharacterized protein LOC110043456 [Orbicella faveolata]
MSSIALVLFAAVFCFQFYSCVGTTPTAVTKKPCEYIEIKKCNHEFKQVFVNAKNSTGRRRPGIHARNRVYCRALQTFMNCLERSLAKCDGGAWLQDYSYVVLEHGMVDKKCNVCRDHNYTNLEQRLHASTKHDYVGYDSCPACARGVHRRCVNRFLEEMNSNSNICQDVQEFITCYKEAGYSKKYCANTKIVKSFSRLCRQLGEKMLKLDRVHPGLMC